MAILLYLLGLYRAFWPTFSVLGTIFRVLGQKLTPLFYSIYIWILHGNPVRTNGLLHNYTQLQVVWSFKRPNPANMHSRHLMTKRCEKGVNRCYRKWCNSSLFSFNAYQDSCNRCGASRAISAGGYAVGKGASYGDIPVSDPGTVASATGFGYGGTGDGTAKPKFQIQPGDWRCPNPLCGNINWCTVCW